jgi:hypothetical protein
MTQMEHGPSSKEVTNEESRLTLGKACEKLMLFLNPTPEEIDRRNRERITKIWNRRGRDGFMIIHSAEGAPSTPDQVRHLYPADSPIEDI